MYGQIANFAVLQSDHNVQPVMGAVHMVRPERHFADNHFMHDIEGDINEGHKVLAERSRKGPFRGSRGRSTIMDSSAHTVYRKRSGAFEITFRRGAGVQEFNNLIAKLDMHRMSVAGSYLVFIKGRRRYRLGKLTDFDLDKLSELIEEALQQYGQCGVEVVDSNSGGRGALNKPGVHSARFKSKTRRNKGNTRR